jgi:uncharacterized protein
METRPPLPPFTLETAIQKVRLADHACKSREPDSLSHEYTVDNRWQNDAGLTALGL